MQTDVFQWHGYVDVWLNGTWNRGQDGPEDLPRWKLTHHAPSGRWIKSTPAFNISLCEKFGWLPLDFDGENDSIYHPFDKKGARHMEYLRYRGVYVEVPREEMEATFGKKHSDLTKEDFLADVDREIVNGGSAAKL